LSPSVLSFLFQSTVPRKLTGRDIHQILDDAKLADVTLVGQVPRQDWNGPAYTWREIKAAMTKSNSLNGTGYSIYSGSLSLPWNDGPNVDQPASSFYVSGVKEGKEVRNEFKFWEEIPRCSTT